MNKKLYYYMLLFLYSLRLKNNITKNSLFRYIYIFMVSNSFLNDDESEILDELIIDPKVGTVNTFQMESTLKLLSSQDYISLNSFKINICDKLLTECSKNQKRSKKFKDDLKSVAYFVNMISSYSDEIVLSIFFNEPNIEDALSRNKTKISLSNNQLYKLLENFQNRAKSSNVDLDKYDVFIAWLDYIFEEYLKGKEINA